MRTVPTDKPSAIKTEQPYEHSPLPWETWQQEGSDFIEISSRRDYDDIARLPIGGNSQANAEYIVASVNHADKLAEALRDIRDCAFDPWQVSGVEAGKSTIAIAAFSARVYSVAKAALAAYESEAQS